MSTVKEKWDRGRKKAVVIMPFDECCERAYSCLFVFICANQRVLSITSDSLFESVLWSFEKNTCLHSIWPEISWSSLCRHTATMLSKLKRKLVFTSFCRHGFFFSVSFQLSTFNWHAANSVKGDICCKRKLMLLQLLEIIFEIELKEMNFHLYISFQPQHSDGLWFCECWRKMAF